MYELEDVDTTPIRSREHVYNGVTYVFTASDPYGMWTIKSKVGSTSDKLSGQFTSLSEAEKAVERFHSAREASREEFNAKNTKEPKALAAAKRHQEYLKLKQEQDELNKG